VRCLSYGFRFPLWYFQPVLAFDSPIIYLMGALMVEVWIGTMALQNLQQYGCQTGNKLREESRDLNRNSSRFFFN
jgi:Ni/Fe-hydrogenase subunit HybB-like protein